MAGKRQHYIPRLLQRGFLHDPHDKAERTWLHRRNMPARLVGIRDVGVEDWFYSKKSTDGTPTLDDIITNLEHALGPTVGIWREAVPGTAVDASVSASTIAHLVFRTAHLRRVFTTAANSLMQESRGLFSDPERVSKMLGLTGPTLSTIVTDQFKKSAAKFAEHAVPPAFSERLMTFIIREFGEHFVFQITSKAEHVFNGIINEIESTIRNAHNSFLTKTPEENKWIQTLAGFNWSIEAAEGLILPDAVALAGEADGQFNALLFSSVADVKIVLMPVSPEKMLVGRRDTKTAIDLTDFNLNAASISENFFVSATDVHADHLRTLIGTSVTNTIQQKISNVVSQVLEGHKSGATRAGLVQAQNFELHDFSYSVKLSDFGDEAYAKELGEVIQAVVEALSRKMPLHDLDGFTLAVDYRKALEEVDRGTLDLGPITSSALEYGVGVAMPITVLRDGKRKEHLVIQADLACSCLSEDPSERATGLYMLVKMLAGVAHFSKYVVTDDNRFEPDLISREFHMAVASTPSEYWSAREAAFINPDHGKALTELIMKSLDFARTSVTTARLGMKDNTDVQMAVTSGLHCLGATLSHVAEWLGHRDGLGADANFEGDDLPKLLEVWGLAHWLDLFGRDLAACYPGEDDLDLSVVVTLSRHVERLLWAIGIYCWPTEEHGVFCMVTDRPFQLTPADLLPGSR